MRNTRNILLAVSVLTLFCLSLAYAGGMEDENMMQMKKFYSDVVNKGNLALIDEFCAKNFVEHEGLPTEKSGLEGVKDFFKMYRTAFPDLKFEVSQMIAKDDKVVSYINITGTNKGEFMGKPATGKRINIEGIDIVRFQDGKAVEHWGVTDTMTMMEQLGAIPKHGAEGTSKN